MNELSSKDMLQPSLLDRLTDDEPGVHVESVEKRVLSLSRLRESVRRDIGFLLNSTHLSALQSIAEFPDVERSTVNYGIPDVAGRPASTIDRAALARAVRQAIIDFEPRLLRQTVKVSVEVDPEGFGANTLRFEIEADLWSEPLPLRLRLRTNMNLEDGEAVVVEADG
jgi:type VI secretion system protein ImpF